MIDRAKIGPTKTYWRSRDAVEVGHRGRSTRQLQLASHVMEQVQIGPRIV
jgi:hypothetical protein